MDIIYKDEYVTLCIKEPGLDSEKDMPALLKERTGSEHYCVHRLDKAVGGLMVYACGKKSAAKLSAMISGGMLKKEYLAITASCTVETEGQMRDLLFKDSAKNKSYVVKRMRKGVKEALLDYRLIGSDRGKNLFRVSLITGRSHQIRVQFSSRGMPLLGDVKYGSLIKDCGIALHSYALSFPHPESGEKLSFFAPPPDEYPWNVFTLKGEE